MATIAPTSCFKNNVINPASKHFETLKRITCDDNNSAGKTAKFASSLIEMYSLIFKVALSEGAIALRKAISGFCAFAEVLDTVKRVHGIFDGSQKSKCGLISLIFFAAHRMTQSFQYLSKMNLIDLRKIIAIGEKIPVIGLLFKIPGGTLACISCVFEIADHVQKIRAHRIDRMANKILAEQWKMKQVILDRKLHGGITEYEMLAYKAVYKSNAIQLDNLRKRIRNPKHELLTPYYDYQNGSATVIEKQWDNFLNTCYQIQTTPNKVLKSYTVEKLDFEVKKWNTSAKVNYHGIMASLWVIISDIAKIAIIILGFTPVGSLAMTLASFSVASTNFISAFYGKYYEPKSNKALQVPAPNPIFKAYQTHAIPLL